MPSSTDSHLSISNSSHRSGIVATVPGAELLTLQTVLSALGFTDRQGDIRQAEQETHEQSAPLVAALRAYAVDPHDPELAQALAPWVRQAIADTETELQHLQTLQAQYEREAAQEPVKQSLSRSYWQQGKDWVESNVRWLIGSTAQDQATYYAELADKRRAQLTALQTFTAQLHAQIQSSQAELAEPVAIESTAEAVDEVQFLDSPSRFSDQPQPLPGDELERVKDSKAFTDFQPRNKLPMTGPAEKLLAHPDGRLEEAPTATALITEQADQPASDPVFASPAPVGRKLLSSDSPVSLCDQPLGLELSTLTMLFGFVITGVTEWDESGMSVSSAGDVNEDGIADLLIGAPWASPGGNSGAGASYVIIGQVGIGGNGTLLLSSLNGRNGFVLNGVEAGDYSGYAVSSAGDVNGDGIDDLLIGAYGADPGGKSEAGVSYVVFGRAGIGGNGTLSLASLNGSNGFVLSGVAAGDESGMSVSSAGDVNGDGIDDLLIGAPYASPGGNYLAGASYVVFGHSGMGGNGTLSLASLNGSNGFVLSGVAAGDLSGYAVSSAGDVNGDGIDDLLIGALGASPGGNSRAGASYVVFGQAGIGGNGTLPLSSLNGSNGFVLPGVAAGDWSGRSVSSAGDVNGDGIDDLLIGAPGPFPGSNAGASYVVFGQAGMGGNGTLSLASLNGSNGFVLSGVAAGDNSGEPVSSAGDVNGDGIADLVIGAPWASPGGHSRAGASYVVFGRVGIGGNGTLPLSSLNGRNGFVLPGVAEGDHSGWSVSSAGDVNGDGIADLLIGAPYASPGGHSSAGASYVVFGRVFPVIQNILSISQGGRVTLSQEALALPLWLSTALLLFIPCNVRYGQFELPFLNPPGHAILNFTDAQLRAGEVVFVADGGFQAPGYDIRIKGAWMLPVTVDFRPLIEAESHAKERIELAHLTGCEGVTLAGVAVGDYSGWSVSSAGDVNGDGISDLVIGAFNASLGSHSYAGASYVVFGHAGIGGNGTLPLASLNGSNGFVLSGVAEGDYSGRSVSSAGDVNGDGIDDLLIGAPEAFWDGNSSTGASYVVFGQAGIGRNGTLPLASLNGSNGFVLSGVAEEDNSGWSVSSAGDVNRDGIADLLIGAWEASPGGHSYAGASYVVFGHAGIGGNGTLPLASLNGSNGFVLPGVAAEDYSGYAVSGAGDVNDDGIDDLFIGAPGAFPGGNSSAGASYVVFGQANIGGDGTLLLSSLNGRNGFVLPGVAAGDQSGGSVSSAGDVNGDGIDDLLIGAPGATPGGNYQAGASYVVFGHAGIGRNGTLPLSTLNGSNGFVLSGAEEDYSGWSVSSAGDVNEDGIDDLLIGALGASPDSNSRAGASYVVFGQAGIGGNGILPLSSLNGSNGFVLLGVAERDLSGSAVSSAGDVNGDGIDDLVIGAFNASSGGNSRTGASYVVFGMGNTSHLQLQLLKNRLPLFSGETLLLSEQYFNVTVRCGDPGAVTYQISGVQHGRFELAASPGVSITTFNQSQVTQQQVQFVHDDSLEPPQFTLQISTDFYTLTVPGFVHFNARPDLVNNSLPVNQGELMPVLPTFLWATDREGRERWLQYNVSNVRGGQFQWQEDVTGTAITTFSGQNISDGVVFFQHDGGNLKPTYTVTVTDHINTPYTTEGGVNFHLLPSLVNNQLIINQGESALLTSTLLSAQSPQVPAGQLRFLVSDVTGGAFKQVASNGAKLAGNLTSFSQQAVQDQQIQFVHNGATLKPGYRMVVTDGQATMPKTPQWAVVSFNYAPVLALSNLTLDQGRATGIHSQYLSANDTETPDSNLVFTVSDVQGGQFECVFPAELRAII